MKDKLKRNLTNTRLEVRPFLASRDQNFFQGLSAILIENISEYSFNQTTSFFFKSNYSILLQIILMT